MRDSFIYSIDSRDLEADIAACDKAILQAEEAIKEIRSLITSHEIEKEKLVNIKLYMEKRASHLNPPAPKLKSDLFGSNSISAPIIIKKGKEYGETTKFIRDLVIVNKVIPTKEIMRAYAHHIGDTVENVEKNVSRTLGRLKEAGIINNPAKPGGQRGGRVWHYIENESSYSMKA